MKTTLTVLLFGLLLCGCSQKETAKHYPKGTLVFSGYSSPESSFESYVWAMTKGDKTVYLQSMAPDVRKKFEEHLAGKTDAEIKEEFAKGMGFPGYTVQKQDAISADEVVLEIMLDGDNKVEKLSLKKIGSEWKLAGGSD
jgi:hypothetical protein